jgi:hypothetical protein
MAAVSRQFQRTSRVRRWRPDWLAGAGGFETPHGGVKIRCLTTWLRPIRQPACAVTARGP